MELKYLFGRKIKQLREKRNLTQQALAELCDMQPNSIGLIENGQRGATFPTIEILAKELDVNFFELFDFDMDIDHSKERLIKELTAKISNFDIVLLEHMVNYANTISSLYEKAKQNKV